MDVRILYHEETIDGVINRAPIKEIEDMQDNYHTRTRFSGLNTS